MTALLLPLLFNLILFKFMTLAKSEPNQVDKIDNKLPKLNTTQQPTVSEEEMRQAVRTTFAGTGKIDRSNCRRTTGIITTQGCGGSSRSQPYVHGDAGSAKTWFLDFHQCG